MFSFCCPLEIQQAKCPLHPQTKLTCPVLLTGSLLRLGSHCFDCALFLGLHLWSLHAFSHVITSFRLPLQALHLAVADLYTCFGSLGQKLAAFFILSQSCVIWTSWDASGLAVVSALNHQSFSMREQTAFNFPRNLMWMICHWWLHLQYILVCC